MTGRPDIVEFLLARIAEEEEAFHRAAEAQAEECRRDGMPGMTRVEVETYWLRPKGVGVDDVERAGTGWPRHLRECEAKRRIVQMSQGSQDFTDAMPSPGYAQHFHSPSSDVLVRVLQLLALPYADHPDYRPQWGPDWSPE